MDGEPQARATADAGRQSALPAEAEVRGDHGLRSRSTGVSESGAADDADRHRSALAGRHHLRSAGSGVRLPGGDSGRLLAARDRLGVGLDAGGFAHAGSPAHGAVAAQSLFLDLYETLNQLTSQNDSLVWK